MAAERFADRYNLPFRLLEEQEDERTYKQNHVYMEVRRMVCVDEGLLERFWNAIKLEEEEEEWLDVEEELYGEFLKRESLPRRVLKKLIQMDLEMFGDMAEGTGIAAKWVKKLLLLDKKLLEKLEMRNESFENCVEKEGKSMKEKERKLMEGGSGKSGGLFS